MRVTYEDVKRSEEIRTYITQADASLIALGYTEHSFAHVTRCAEVAGDLLAELGLRTRWSKTPKSFSGRERFSTP